jgi:phosphopantothenoylcysteine decarboxylase
MTQIPSSANQRTPDASTRKVIILGVGGGIAAYKSATICSQLVQAGHDVRVVMTSAATHFIGAATFAALSGKPVATDSFEPQVWPLGPHIQLAENADLLVIAPATANLMGQFANGLASDLLSTLYLQAACPVLLAPAMSNQMWEKPAVQRNLSQLRADGCHFVGPDSGWLSCRQQGFGRMSDPDAIVAEIAQMLIS